MKARSILSMTRFLFTALLFLFAGNIEAQAPLAHFTFPANGDTFTDPNITVTWKGCSNATQSYSTQLNGVGQSTTQSSTFPCPDYLIGKNYSSSVTLANGVNYIYINVCDVSGCGDSTITVTYSGPAILVTPHTGPPQSIVVEQDSSFVLNVKNTGGVPDTARFSYSCPVQLGSCSISQNSAFMSPGDSVTVIVSYTGAQEGPATVWMTARYAIHSSVADSGQVSVSVEKKPNMPKGSFISPSDGDTLTNPNVTIRWQGCSDNSQTSADTYIGDSVLTTSPESPPQGCPDYVTGITYSASGILHSGANLLWLKVCDDIYPCGRDTITVYYDPPAVSVTPDGGNANPVGQGDNGSYQFKVKNIGPTSATANFTVSCSGDIACNQTPAPVTIGAGDSTNVTASYRGVNVGSGRVTLTATYAGFPGVKDTGYVDVTVTEPVTWGVTVTPVEPTQPITAGNATIQFHVANVSAGATQSSKFGLVPTVSGSVLSCNQPDSITVAPGDSTTVNVSCTISSSGTTGSVTLTAATNDPVAFSGNGTSNITISPVYKIAVLPASAAASVNGGTTNNYSVTIQNTSTNTSSSIMVKLLSPTCSGVTLDNCSVPDDSASIAPGSQTAPIVLTYSALAAGTETITLVPSGHVTGGDVEGTNGTLDVTVGSNIDSLSVSLAGKNPGTTIEKADCLTIAAGQNAAYECGDLRVVHPLPTTLTMDRPRGPALIYNSRHANAGTLLAADVSFSGTTPQTLRATVKIPGQTNTVKSFPWSSACATTCRIVVPVTTTQPTNLYAVTLEVAAMNGSTIVGLGSNTDTVVIVNRASSPFGAGWWLDGLESLITVSDTKMLWVGGDGSTRLYSKASDTDFTVNPAYDRPDTLKKVGTSWRRLLGDSAFVEFDSTGRHTRTRNALGWITTFAYANDLLDNVTLPVPSYSTEVRSYRFWYTDSKLDSIQAPTARLSRTTHVVRNEFKVDSIIDPDGYATAFAYDGSGRIISRTNKLGDATTFAYDGGGALRQSSLNMVRTNGAGSFITTNFRAAETRSAYDSSDVPVVPSNIYTQLDGPRDVGDTTNIIVNRFGAPDSVSNALGQRTLITRGNGTFPALATKVVGVNGLETRAFYNSRGLTDSTVVVNPYDNDSSAVTKYTWNSKWNQVDSVTHPEGEVTRMFYRSSTPILDSMRIGTLASRVVKFSYTGDSQVESVTEPGSLPDMVFYDSLGNTKGGATPVALASANPTYWFALKDAIGRDTLTGNPDYTNLRYISYDSADRVALVYNYGPARPYSLQLNASFSADTAQINPLIRTDTSAYDKEGHLVYQHSSGGGSDAQFDDTFSYDAAGRLTSRSVGAGPDSMVYDPAGNAVSIKQRSGLWVTQTYDVLNRLTSRVVPQKS